MTKHATTASKPDVSAQERADIAATVGAHLGTHVMTVLVRHRAAVADHPTLDLARKNYALSILDAIIAELTSP